MFARIGELEPSMRSVLILNRRIFQLEQQSQNLLILVICAFGLGIVLAIFETWERSPLFLTILFLLTVYFIFLYVMFQRELMYTERHRRLIKSAAIIGY